MPVLAEEVVQPAARPAQNVDTAAEQVQGPRAREERVPNPPSEEAARLLVAYGIRGNTPTMLRLRERLPTCGTIDASYNRTECFLIDAQALLSLEEEFPGQMGYVMP